jgi:hypothetical protein
MVGGVCRRIQPINNAGVGRALDCLYETGVTEVFAGVAAHPLQVYCIQHRVVHLDSTSVSLQGEYARAPKVPRAVQIAYGDSKDQLPKLKQALVALMCTYRSAIQL